MVSWGKAGGTRRTIRARARMLAVVLLTGAALLAGGRLAAQGAQVPTYPANLSNPNLDRLKRIQAPDGIRRAVSFPVRIIEAQVIEQIEQSPADAAVAAPLLTRALDDGTYLAQMCAAYQAGALAQDRGTVPPELVAALQKKLSPPFSETELGRMCAYAVQASTWNGLTPQQRVAAHEQLLKQDPRYGRIFLQHWSYHLPTWAPARWKTDKAFADYRRASAATLYFHSLTKEPVANRVNYADSLLKRVEDRFYRLQQAPPKRADDSTVEELQALAQRLIDFGPTSVERMAQRQQLLHEAVTFPANRYSIAGHDCLLDVLRSIGGKQAQSLLLNIPKGKDPQADSRLSEAGLWLLEKTPYPYKVLHIYRWAVPPMKPTTAPRPKPSN